jgi:beta-galactosidase
MKHTLVSLLFVALIPSSLHSAETLSMNKGWRFRYVPPDSRELPALLTSYYRDAQSASIGWRTDPLMQPAFDDSAWRILDVPHDFVIEGSPSAEANDLSLEAPIDNKGFLERGIGIYRRTFDLVPPDKGKRIWIRFDGVFRDARVFLNGFLLTNHRSGYTPFRVDISDVAHYGNAANILLVIADSRQSEGWWYEGGGIYRPVCLEKSGGSLYFEPDGIAVNPVLSDDYSSAAVEVSYSIQNRQRGRRTFTLVTRILDRSNQQVQSSSQNLQIDSWGRKEYRTSLTLNAPRLWSLEERNLYFVSSEIRENGSTVESAKTRVGIRRIVFTADHGLFLNGKHVKVTGAATHQDNGSVGTAVPLEIIRSRIRLMKDFGFNGYRSAHHAAAPALLDICDEEGMLVINEQRVPETGSKYLEEFRDIVRYSRNHPSVFLYNLANEENNIVATAFEEGLASTLMQEIARLDPQLRPATMNRIFWKPDEKDKTLSVAEYLKRAYSGAGRILDVAGFSYSDDVMYAYEAKGQPIVQTESSGNMCTRGAYEDNKDRLWVSSLPDWKIHERIKRFMTTDRISGAFVWTAFDYRGEPTPYRVFPGVSSQFGLFDLCGFPKDPAFFYRAVQKAEPVLHLFPHWTWKGREGKTVKVFTYTNLEEVELFLNGRSVGRQKVRPFENQSWDVTYEPGTLVARGYRNGTTVRTDRVATAGEPRSIRISANRDSLKADGDDAATVRFEILDENGVVCPNADNIVEIAVDGSGHLLGVDNGDPANVNPTKLPRVRGFSGVCSAVVQSAERPGSLTIRANSEGLRGASLEIKTVATELPPAVKLDLVTKDHMYFRQRDGWKYK